jgi:1-acyl-sn-glycerol-3-phosphate acyltransferase
MKRLIGITLSTISMYLVTHLIVFLLLPFGLLLAIFNQDKALRWLKPRFVDLLFLIVGKRVHITGMEHADGDKGYLIISNYPTFYTMFVLMKIYPDAFVVAKAFISKIPIFGHFMKQIGTVFVDPKRGGSTEAIGKALGASRTRMRMMILPEGGRSPDGSIQRFRRGFVYILRNSAMELLPVTLSGFYTLKPVKRFYMDPFTDLEVIVHKPIPRSVIEQETDQALIQMAEHAIREGYTP